MDYHQNARLSVALREELARRVVAEELTFKAAGLLFHVSSKTAAKWTRRSQQGSLDTKTEASRKPVPLHSSVAKTLAAWRAETSYPAHEDFVFPSTRLNGKKPVSHDMVLKKIIRPALDRAGIKEKVIG